MAEVPGTLAHQQQTLEPSLPGGIKGVTRDQTVAGMLTSHSIGEGLLLLSTYFQAPAPAQIFLSQPT